MKSLPSRIAPLVASSILLSQVGSTRCDAAPTYPFQLELTGMIAFAEEGNAMNVVLVNQPEAGHGVTHFPSLEIDCTHLVSDSFFPPDLKNLPPAEAAEKATKEAKDDCRYGAQTGIPNFRHFALDGGFEVKIRPDGADGAGKNVLDPTYLQLVVPMNERTDKQDFWLLSKKALDPKASPRVGIVKLRLEGGSFESFPTQKVEWSFGTSPFGTLVKFGKAAGSTFWTTNFNNFVDIELKPYDPLAKALVLRLSNSGTLAAVLSNDPDLAEFCAHAPRDRFDAAGHFAGFWGVSAGGAGVPMDLLQFLPLPYPNDPMKMGCSWEEFRQNYQHSAGRRVNCMQVRFSGVEQ